MSLEVICYRTLLAKELAERHRKNPAFSLRAYAKLIGVSAPTLSRILSGKRSLSLKMAKKMLSRMGISPDQKEDFLKSLVGFEGTVKKTSRDSEMIELDKFKMFTEWYHFAILSLGDFSNNKANARWIASQLGIRVLVAEQAFLRLKRLKLVRLLSNGMFRTEAPYWVATQEDESVRSFHHQGLELAKRNLDSEDLNLELFTTMTLAVDESNLSEARKALSRFRKEIESLVENGNPSRVYQFSMQLFPISRKSESRRIK